MLAPFIDKFCWLLFVVCRLLVVACLLLFVVACCFLFVGCCLFVDLGGSFFGVRAVSGIQVHTNYHNRSDFRIELDLTHAAYAHTRKPILLSC